MGGVRPNAPVHLHRHALGRLRRARDDVVPHPGAPGHRQDQRQRLHRQDRHADLRPRRDDEDDRSQGRQQERGRRDVLPRP